MTFRFNVGLALQKAQKSSDISSNDLAKALAVSYMQIYRWQRSEDLKLSRVVELATHFQMPVEAFIKLGEQHERSE